MRFIFNQDREVVSEEDTSGLNRLIRATELIAANSGADSARTYYHYASDEMGSTTHIVDEAGAVQNRYEYDAWGNITAQEEAIPNRFKFTGQQFDPVTQQYYLRARFYNPVVARFTQEDTYRGDGLNLYAYCESNPVLYTDPSGHVSDCIKDAYKKYRQEGYTAAEAYQLAAGKVGVVPQGMTDRQMQMAIDSIYKAQHDRYISKDVMALTIAPEGPAILTANGGMPGSAAREAAQALFGDKIKIIDGKAGTNYDGLTYTTDRGKTNESHAEARAAKALLGDAATVPVPPNALAGIRQASTDYACTACAQMQRDLGITNVTGTKAVEGEGKRTRRLYY